MAESRGALRKVGLAVVIVGALAGVASLLIVVFVVDPWCNVRARACPTRPTTAPFTVTHERPPKGVEDRLRRDDSTPAVRRIGVRANGRLFEAAFRTRGLCGAVEGPTSLELSYGPNADEVTIFLNFIGAKEPRCDDVVRGVVHVDLPEAARRPNVGVTAGWQDE